MSSTLNGIEDFPVGIRNSFNFINTKGRAGWRLLYTHLLAYANTNGLETTLSGSTITANATVDIAGGLTINGSGALTVGAGSTLNVSGNLLGNTTNAAGFNVLGTVVFDGAGTSGSPQQLEVMSEDLGSTLAGFDQNFVYNTLELANDTYVELVDDAVNSPGGTPERSMSTT